MGAAGNWGYEWMYLGSLLSVYAVCVLALFGAGRAEPGQNPASFFFRNISDSLRRLTGFPGWAMAGVLTALMMLLIAVIGFYWDVAWHVDLGRDKEVLTPPHLMIVVGLGGLSFAGAVAALMARLDRARFPRSAVVLAVVGAGAVAAFPVDNLWHEVYGLDLTLWSPPHLQLITGGAFGTLAVLLMIAEGLGGARPTFVGRTVLVMAAGAALAGMTIFQGEFEFGVPQFQLVYLPILVAGASSFTLVLARIALGPWGAIKAVLFYIGLRLVLGAVVAGSLGHTYPRFPLYLTCAVAVEGAAALVGTAQRLRFGLLAGALVGTVGLAGELLWIGLSGYGETSVALLPRIALLAPPAALAAALLGAGLGRAFEHGPKHVRAAASLRAGLAGGQGGVPAPVLFGAGIVLVAVLAFPLRRDVGDVHALIRLDRTDGRAHVAVRLDRPDAARHAAAFGVLSWQGGGRVRAELDEVAPGRYVSSRAVPVSGRWKTLVSLYRGEETMAAPVYLPGDRAIGASAIPAVPTRRGPFVRNTDLLLREAKPGPPFAATLAWAGWLGSIAIWVALMGLTATRTGRREPDAPAPAAAAPEPRLAPAGPLG